MVEQESKYQFSLSTSLVIMMIAGLDLGFWIAVTRWMGASRADESFWNFLVVYGSTLLGVQLIQIFDWLEARNYPNRGWAIVVNAFVAGVGLGIVNLDGFMNVGVGSEFMLPGAGTIFWGLTGVFIGIFMALPIEIIRLIYELIFEKKGRT